MNQPKLLLTTITAAMLLLHSSGATGATVSQTATIQLNSHHTLSAGVNLGAVANFNDSDDATMNLFDPALGTLTKVTLKVKSNAPSMVGNIAYGPLAVPLSIVSSYNQFLTFGLTNCAVNGVGSAGGYSNSLVNLLLAPAGGSTTINGSPSNLDSTTEVTSEPTLGTFVGNGTFRVNANVASHLATAASILPTTLTGNGSYTVDVGVDYEYNAPDPTASPTPTPTATPTPTPTPAGSSMRLSNISTRMVVGTGENIGIGGFIISGTLPKRVVVRGIGPSLVNSGIAASEVLADPIIQLHNDLGLTIASNNNWQENQSAAIQSTGLAPSDSQESAIIATLPPGLYTVTLSGNNSTTGVGLVEIYDLDSNETSGGLGNLSSRGMVGSGDNVLIGGMIAQGNGLGRVLIRGLGPSLHAQGISNPLSDPSLGVYDANGTALSANEDWSSSAEAQEIADAGLAPTDIHESALLLTMVPGNYTAVVRGNSGATGIGMIEFYGMDN